MEHRFYTKTKREQNQIFLLIGIGAFLAILFVLFVSWTIGFFLLGILIFSIVLSIVAPFFDTPSLVKSGKLMYHSPLFLSEKPKKGVVIIHGGTLFDYVFVLDKKMNGTQRTKFILQQYVEGLLNFIEHYKDHSDDALVVRGTSYIINAKTAERLGFKIRGTDFGQTLILTFNYFNIMLSSSFAKKKLSFPKLNDTKTFEASLDDLAARKVYINRLNEKLKSTMTDRSKIVS